MDIPRDVENIIYNYVYRSLYYDVIEELKYRYFKLTAQIYYEKLNYNYRGFPVSQLLQDIRWKQFKYR